MSDIRFLTRGGGRIRTTESIRTESQGERDPLLLYANSDPLVGTLEAFGIYAVGFIARPIGAAIFGHYGDRIGRKSTLIATLMIMGVATFLVALVPTYESIGIWGTLGNRAPVNVLKIRADSQEETMTVRATAR